MRGENLIVIGILSFLIVRVWLCEPDMPGRAIIIAASALLIALLLAIPDKRGER